MVSLIQLYYFQRRKLVNLRIMCRGRLSNISGRVDGDPWRKTILCVKGMKVARWKQLTNWLDKIKSQKRSGKSVAGKSKPSWNCHRLSPVPGVLHPSYLLVSLRKVWPWVGLQWSPSMKMRMNNTMETSLQYMENKPFSRGFYSNSGGITFCLKGVMKICFQKQTDVKNVRVGVNNFWQENKKN